MEKDENQCNGDSNEAVGFDAAPFGVEVFGDKPAVAVMRQVLAAKQATTVESGGLNDLFNLPLRHQIQELLFVNAPIPFLLLMSQIHRATCDEITNLAARLQSRAFAANPDKPEAYRTVASW